MFFSAGESRIANIASMLVSDSVAANSRLASAYARSDKDLLRAVYSRSTRNQQPGNASSDGSRWTCLQPLVQQQHHALLGVLPTRDAQRAHQEGARGGVDDQGPE